MIGIVNYSKNERLLKKWKDKSTKLRLKSIRQVLFFDGRHAQENIDGDDDAWFLLEMTDGENYAHLEIQINTSAEMGSNVFKVLTVYEYFKDLMYVDKRELNDFFECVILSENKGQYCLACENC